jgi:membrane-associated phospholipid phosphatase
VTTASGLRATPSPAATAGPHPRRAELAHTVRERGAAVVLLLSALFALTCAAGLLVTDVLDDSALVRWDVDAVRDLAAHRTDAWDTATGVTLVFSDTIPVAVLLVVGVVGLAWATRDWVAPVFLALAVGGEKLVYQLATLVVDRPRPPVDTVGVVHAQSSFPSGHVGSAVALWGAFAVLAVWFGWVRRPAGRALLTLVVVLIAVSVSLSRTYRGVHHPIDVAAGALVGLGALAIARWAVLDGHPWRGRRVEPDQSA